MTQRTSLGTVFLLSLAVGCAGSADSAGPAQDGNVGFGGAQDIGQFRDILEQGDIPGPNTLDANGFMNEHYIELPPADCGQVLCGHALVSVGRDWVERDYQAALQIAMNTPIDPTTLERKPLNLVVVVDVSGSMAEDDRIGYARQGLHLLADELGEGDQMALVTYATGVTVAAELGTDPDALHEVIDGLVASGSTNFYGGLEAGMQMLANSFDPERQNRVILLSDGQPTAGITGEASIIDMAESYITDGIGLTTVGVGTGFNVELMRGLSERGAGNFYYLEDAQAIAEVFTDELDYFASPIALDVHLEVEAGPSYDLGEVVGTRLWKTEGATGAVHVPAVFLASRTSAEPDPNGRRGGGSTVFVRMLPRSSGTSIDPEKVASLTLTYRLPDSSELVSQTVEVTNPHEPGTAPEDAWFSHQAMAKNYAVYNVFLGLQSATVEAADYRPHCALGILTETAGAIESWNATAQDPDLTADLELIEMFRGNLQAQGARADAEDPLAACEPGYDPYQDDYYGDDTYEEGYYCSAGAGGGSAAGALLVLGAAIALASRRRHRSYGDQ